MSGSLMSWLAPAAIGLGSAFLGSRASQQAADTSAAAANRAADTQMAMFQQNRADLEPWRAAGQRGLSAYEQSIGPTFQESPGYQFAIEQGVNAIDRAASARGLLNSGARLRELTRYGQGMANQEFGNWQNRLAALAGIGQTATGQTAALGTNAANNIAQTQMAAGNAQAAGGVNATNAVLGGANAGLGLYALMNPSWGSVQRRPVE